MFWCSGLTLYCWNVARINHLYLFEIDPRNSYNWREVLYKATKLTILLEINVLAYYKIENETGNRVVATCSLLIFGVYLLYAIVFPVRSFDFWQCLRSVVVSPFAEVSFYSAFVADLFTSMIKPVVDLCYTLCFFMKGEWLEEKGVRVRGLLGEEGAMGSLATSNNYTRSLISTNNHSMRCIDMNRYFLPIVVTPILYWRFVQNLRR